MVCVPFPIGFLMAQTMLFFLFFLCYQRSRMFLLLWLLLCLVGMMSLLLRSAIQGGGVDCYRILTIAVYIVMMPIQ